MHAILHYLSLYRLAAGCPVAIMVTNGNDARSRMESTVTSMRKGSSWRPVQNVIQMIQWWLAVRVQGGTIPAHVAVTAVQRSMLNSRHWVGGRVSSHPHVDSDVKSVREVGYL